MSCPLCGDRCTCSHVGAASSLIDPEGYDLSEERFSASLEQVAAERASGRTAHRPRSDSEEAWDLVGASAVPAAGTQAGLESREANRGVDEGAFWRNEVASRVESYRARRRRPIRERSLPLDFERAVNREVTSGNLSASVEEDECQAGSPEPRGERSQEFAAGPQLDPWPEERQESKIIEFPRQAMLPVMPPSIEELAEHILDRPRILEVPEEVDTAAPLADINVAPEENAPAIEFELPLQVAPMSQRVFAGLVDALIVLAGAAVFVLIVLKAGVPMPQAKAGFLLAMAVPCVFWAIYEYLFLVYAGVTPGMQMACLQLATFDGVPARRHVRRGRSVAIVLSTLSLGLGLVWALLDEDTLCWHDRITRTYVVAGSS